MRGAFMFLPSAVKQQKGCLPPGLGLLGRGPPPAFAICVRAFVEPGKATESAAATPRPEGTAPGAGFALT